MLSSIAILMIASVRSWVQNAALVLYHVHASPRLPVRLLCSSLARGPPAMTSEVAGILVQQAVGHEDHPLAWLVFQSFVSLVDCCIGVSSVSFHEAAACQNMGYTARKNLPSSRTRRNSGSLVGSRC